VHFWRPDAIVRYSAGHSTPRTWSAEWRVLHALCVGAGVVREGASQRRSRKGSLLTRPQVRWYISS